MTARFTALAALSVCLLLAAAVRAQDAATFTVHPDDVVGPPLVGFGAQFNPYLYATPNFTGNGTTGDVTDANVADLERKLLDLRPQHVRIFFALEWWDGKPDGIAKGDPRMKESFLRTARLAQQCGATINLTYWHGPWPDPQRQASRFADIVKELREKHDLPSIRYVTLQNEPNLHKFDVEKLTSIYRPFDARARRIGLRDDVQIIGGDLVQNSQEEWFAGLAKHQPFLDGYAVHMYWDYWDTAKLLRRVSEVPPIVAALPARARKPLYVTEFGVRGKRDQPGSEPGLHEPDGRVITDVPLHGMQIAWFMMEAINRGYVATVQWDAYTAWYDRYMHFGVIGGAKDGWPLRPAYHVLRMFTHTTQPGWRAVRVEGKAEALLISAVRRSQNELTVFVLNRADEPRRTNVQGLPPRKLLNRLIWNAAGDGKLTAGVPMEARPGTAVLLDIPARGIVALTSAKHGL